MVLPVGCGGSRAEARPGYLDRAALERAVLRDAEQRLMTSSPRESRGGTATHVRSVRCSPRGERAFRCRIALGAGGALLWDVSVTADGRRFTVVRTSAGGAP